MTDYVLQKLATTYETITQSVDLTKAKICFDNLKFKFSNRVSPKV